MKIEIFFKYRKLTFSTDYPHIAGRTAWRMPAGSPGQGLVGIDIIREHMWGHPRIPYLPVPLLSFPR